MNKSASFWVMAVILAAASTPAIAQSSEEDGATVGDIVVTAQKREQSLQNVPMSVTALDDGMLRDAGAITMEGVSRMVPSLTTVQGDSPISQSYRIRGIGSNPAIPTFEPDVGLFIDGVYLPRSGLGVDDLVDLERIEVLAGPQSTLYGKNVTGGVINVVTKAPSSIFEGHVAVSVSQLKGARNAGAVRTEGSVSGPLNDSVRFRLTGVYYGQGATFVNLVPGAGNANDMKRYAIRGVMEFDLSANIRLSVTGARTEVMGAHTNDPDMLYYGVTPLALDTQLGPVFGVTPCADNDPTNRVICTDKPYESTSYSDILSATLTSSIGANTITSITAWSDYSTRKVQDDIDQMRIPLLAFRDRQSGKTFTQEVRLVSPGGEKIDWLAGGYYLHSTFARGDHGQSPTFILQDAAPFIPLAPGIPFGQPGDLGFIDSRAQSDYFAVFGQGTYHLNEQFVLTGGLRWQTETKTASINNSSRIDPTAPGGINILSVALTPGGVNGGFRHQTDGFTWSATGEYHPDEDSMIYVTYARGGKSGGFNIGFGSAPRANRPFGDETADSYELGAKWTSPDRRARLNVSAFRTVYSNYQDAGYVSLQFLVNNAAKVTTQGFEASGVFAIAKSLTLNASATYADAKYNNYTSGSCYPGEVPNNADGSGCDLSGKSLPLIPDWRTNVSLQYEHPIGPSQLYGRIDWSWSADSLTNTNLDPRSVQPAFSLLNLRFGLRTESGVDASIWITNLANETYVSNTGISNIFGDDPAYQVNLGAPREIGFTLRKQF